MKDTIIELKPENILLEGNSRFALLPHRISAMQDSIKEKGKIHTAVFVEELKPALKVKDRTYTHKAVTGFYRITSALALNKKGGTYVVPAIVVRPADALARLNLQLSENMDRQNQTPMDDARAIKLLLDAGIPKMEIRKRFSRPRGSKMKPEPASNSWLNITVSFLELDESIQEMISDGRVTWSAAYELTRLSAEERTARLAKIETARLAAEATEDKREVKLLEDARSAEEKRLAEEKKEKDKADAIATSTTELETAKEVLDTATAAHKAKVDEASELYKTKQILKGEEAKSATAKWKVAQGEVNTQAKAKADAEKALTDAQKKFDKASPSAAVVTDDAAKSLDDAKKKAPPAPPIKKKAPAAITDKDIKNAAGTAVPMKGDALRRAIKEHATLPGPYDSVREIASVYDKMSEGILTPGQAYTDLAKITGEWVDSNAPKKLK